MAQTALLQNPVLLGTGTHAHLTQSTHGDIGQRRAKGLGSSQDPEHPEPPSGQPSQPRPQRTRVGVTAMKSAEDASLSMSLSSDVSDSSLLSGTHGTGVVRASPSPLNHLSISSPSGVLGVRALSLSL